MFIFILDHTLVQRKERSTIVGGGISQVIDIHLETRSCHPLPELTRVLPFSIVVLGTGTAWYLSCKKNLPNTFFMYLYLYTWM